VTQILLRHGVRERLATEAARCSGRPEVGGILIGCYRGRDIDIRDYTGRGDADVSALFSFVRMDPSHQRAATAAWSTSGQTDTFVGEWHTHPFGEPAPSSVDTATWRRLTRDNGRPMAFAVVSPGAWKVFVVKRTRLRWAVTVTIEAEVGGLGVVLAGEG
jgi:integrative and conjugative element protein (TIGR02256 family)